MRATCCLLLLVIAFASCQSNQIYVDFDKQFICSSNSKPITNLYITGNNGKEYYHISWRDTTSNAPNQLRLLPLTRGYVADKGYHEYIPDIKLHKNSVYTILRGQGDAGTYSIDISTDASGNMKASRITKP